MNEAQNQDFGIPENVVAPGAEPKVERDVFGLRKQYKKITVYEDRAPGAESVCKVGVNGRVFLIRRGQQVIVPVDVVSALDNAVQEVTTKFEGGIETRPALRFPYQFHGDATEAEYQAYQQKMKAGQAARAAQVAA